MIKMNIWTDFIEPFLITCKEVYLWLFNTDITIGEYTIKPISLIASSLLIVLIGTVLIRSLL